MQVSGGVFSPQGHGGLGSMCHTGLQHPFTPPLGGGLADTQQPYGMEPTKRMVDFHPTLQQASLQNMPHSPAAQSAVQQQGFIAYAYNMEAEQRLRASAASLNTLQMEYAKWAEVTDGDAAAGLHAPPGTGTAPAAHRRQGAANQAFQRRSAAKADVPRPLGTGGRAPLTNAEVQAQIAANANPETMKSQLQALQLEDPAQVFIARRINKLGFASSEQLRLYFARYGEVKSVHVSHSRVKSLRPVSQRRCPNVQWRLRAAALGFVVMADREATGRIIQDGPQHEVNGVMVRVQPFHRCSTAAAAPGDDDINGLCDAASVASLAEDKEEAPWMWVPLRSLGLQPDHAQQLIQMRQFQGGQGPFHMQQQKQQQQSQFQPQDPSAGSFQAAPFQPPQTTAQAQAHPQPQMQSQKSHGVRQGQRSQAPPGPAQPQPQQQQQQPQQHQQQELEQQLRRLQQKQMQLARRLQQMTSWQQPTMDGMPCDGAGSGSGLGAGSMEAASDSSSTRDSFEYGPGVQPVYSEGHPSLTGFMYVSVQDLQNAMPAQYED